MSKLKWEEKEHPIFGKGGSEEGAWDVVTDKNLFPRKQWKAGKFSIIPPCGVSFLQWELYPVNGDVERFNTLEEAQKRAEELTGSGDGA